MLSTQKRDSVFITLLFTSNMIISQAQMFLCIKKEEYDCIPLSIDIIPYYGIGRIVHSANLCAYIIAQKKSL